jgi:hypothetical protein
MAQISLSVEIAAPANLVGALFIPQRMPYWFGEEMDCRFEVQRGASEFQPGLKVKIIGQLAKREVSLVAVVTEYQRGRLLEWRFRDSYGVSGMQRWEIQPVGQGARVVMRDEYELPGRFGKFWDRIFTQYAVRARDRRDLERLKRTAEQAGGRTPAPATAGQ